MRIPVPIVLALCLAVVVGTWWYWTRHHDFLTPPPDCLATAEGEARHPAISGEADLPPDGQPDPPPDLPPAAAAQAGESTGDQPGLNAYLELARQEPGSLPGLAAALEEQGDHQRALLAHERVIDSTQPAPGQLAVSLQASRRLREQVPPWNPMPEMALQLTLHAGTSQQNAERIAPAIENLAAEITRASAGILRVQPVIHRSPSPPPGELPPPVAVWLTGTSQDTTTPVISLTLDADENPRPVVTLTLLKILRSMFSGDSQPHIPIAIATADDPAAPLFTHVTRRVWSEIGKRLTPPGP